jgi:hypothetical protein
MRIVGAIAVYLLAIVIIMTVASYLLDWIERRIRLIVGECLRPLISSGLDPAHMQVDRNRSK